MTTLKKALFVINPIAGSNNTSVFIKKIESLGNTYKGFDISIFVWNTIRQKKELRTLIENNNYERVIAVGGDGTINMIGKYIIKTDIKLAIIPIGSGNGLARHLNLSMNFDNSLETVFGNKTKKIDVGTINGKYFLCSTGLGFEAVVANEFGKDTVKRGLSSYVRNGLKSFFSYKMDTYIIKSLKAEIKVKAFLLSIANTNQIGNNAYLAPQAKTNDGMLDLVIISKVPLLFLPFTIIRLFNKTLDRSKYVKTIRAKSFTIKRTTHAPIHYDGEPKSMGYDFEIKAKPSALIVVTG